ncbi:hypothetical protein OUZ56_028664 [Daphnia magna]|uniref:Uncharacterized protein n=1 Tax=Daphnia magna TaxID=35525 RepID=A0ABR0B4J1_9CRUS|nr:hypothetical protein OUZ56_028664 [Daphnia magna]
MKNQPAPTANCTKALHGLPQPSVSTNEMADKFSCLLVYYHYRHYFYWLEFNTPLAVERRTETWRSKNSSANCTLLPGLQPASERGIFFLCVRMVIFARWDSAIY